MDNEMTPPADRRYSQTHEWFSLNDDVVTVGITQFAADELTDITFVDLPAVGTTVQAGAEFGEIESVKAPSELFTVAGGEVTEINNALADAPELVNSDPFEEGWMIRIRVADPSPIKGLMNASEYEAHCAAQEHSSG